MSATKTKRRCAAQKSAEHRLIALPGLGFLKGSVQTKDFAVGAGVGLLGQGGVKWALEKIGVIDQIPAIAQRFMPLLSGVITGYGLLLLDKKVLKKGRGRAHMIGAIAAGAVVQAWQELQAQFPDKFNDYVYLPAYNGVLLDRPSGMNGVLVDTQRSAANLSALNAYNLANREEDAI